MENGFNDLYWHDAIIKDLRIDRTDPGKNDTICFEMEWPENKGKVLFVFEDVYWARMNLNFGIVAEETIMNALQLDNNDPDLGGLYTKWKGVIDDVILNVYKIDLNSTGGDIKIIAKGFSVKEL